MSLSDPPFKSKFDPKYLNVVTVFSLSSHNCKLLVFLHSLLNQLQSIILYVKKLNISIQQSRRSQMYCFGESVSLEVSLFELIV